MRNPKNGAASVGNEIGTSVGCWDHRASWGDLRSGDGRGQIPAPNSRVRRAGSETRDQLPSTSILVLVGDDLGTNEGGTVRSTGPYGATAITIQGRRNVATSWRFGTGRSAVADPTELRRTQFKAAEMLPLFSRLERDGPQ